jgi:hypothetical protein
MRFVLTGAVLLAVVGTALVAVCQHSERRRLQRCIWELDRRRERLEREALRLDAVVEAGRTPRRLLEARDAYAGAAPAASAAPWFPPGLRGREHFEGGGR